MQDKRKYKIGILVSHPVQYYVPWYKALAKHPGIDLRVFYCHRQSPQAQGEAGFGVDFEWDIPLLDGYAFEFLKNNARCPGTDNFFGCNTPGISDIIRSSNFDAFIVQGWNLLSYWQAVAACRRCRVPVFVRGDSQLSSNHSLLKRAARRLTHSIIIPKFDAYLAVGSRSRNYYLHYGAPGNKVYFCPHCVDNDFFSQNRLRLLPQKQALRRQWGIPEQSLIFLFAGKLIGKKRPADFLKALKLSSKSACDIYGLIAGDGPLRSELEAFCLEASVPVKFCGFLNQSMMPQAYTVSDCLVLPSDERETWGMVVNEAFASSVPAITAFEVGSCEDLIIQGNTGESFPCGDVTALSEIICRFSRQREHLKKMGENAKGLIQSYSVGKAAQGVFEAVSSV